MVQLTVPPSGITLDNSSVSKLSTEGNIPQVMQLDLDTGFLQELLRNARKGGRGVNLSFGKTIALHYGNKSQPLTAASAPPQSQLYDLSTDQSTDLAFAGRLSHKLVMQKAQDDMAGADAALAKLQSQLASHKEAKQSMQIKYIPDSSKLPPPVKQTAASIRHQGSKPKTPSFLKKPNKSLLHHDTTRSLPGSPALGAARMPFTSTTLPTSVPGLPKGKLQRLQALRYPLTHFLAARPASAKLLSQHLNCKEDEILEVLQKVGKVSRLDATKWDLTDKTFKELDIWGFNYPNQDDRELAIGRARSAFDRMRLSTQDKLWDKLLPKQERGKGKVLSHLNLHKGPIQQVTTPKIHIQRSSNESSKDQEATSDQVDRTDRLTPEVAEPMARSRSHGPVKRTKVSEKEAKSKRLLANGPKKAKPDTKAKEPHSAARKAGPKKAITPKSSEYVDDSDEDDGLGETGHASKLETVISGEDRVEAEVSKNASSSVAVSSPKANTDVKVSKSTESSKSLSSTKSKKPMSQAHPRKHLDSDRDSAVSKGSKAVNTGTQKKAVSRPTDAMEKKALPSPASNVGNKNRASDSSQGSASMQKTLSRQRNTSSPHKPSPLGSSPPTNASDFEQTAHSSSSSVSAESQFHNVNGTPNGVGLAVNGHVHNTSEHSLKRKAGDLDSGVHDHGVTPSRGTVNGTAKSSPDVAKRQKTSELESPSSDSSDSSLARTMALKKAQDFKRYYANYKKQYHEVSDMDDAPEDKVEDLMKMHNRLAELKDQIRRGLFRE